MVLRHQLYEEPHHTLGRTRRAGWEHAELVTPEQLQAKYGVETMQAQIHALRAAGEHPETQCAVS